MGKNAYIGLELINLGRLLTQINSKEIFKAFSFRLSPK